MKLDEISVNRLSPFHTAFLAVSHSGIILSLLFYYRKQGVEIKMVKEQMTNRVQGMD